VVLRQLGSCLFRDGNAHQVLQELGCCKTGMRFL
jgi:hypothetical protein